MGFSRIRETADFDVSGMVIVSSVTGKSNREAATVYHRRQPWMSREGSCESCAWGRFFWPGKGCHIRLSISAVVGCDHTTRCGKSTRTRTRSPNYGSEHMGACKNYQIRRFEICATEKMWRVVESQKWAPGKGESMARGYVLLPADILRILGDHRIRNHG